jgi:hypothetical protein
VIAVSGWYQWEGDNLLISVRVQPKSSRNEIVGPHGNALKVRITATPVDGKANSHLITYLASQFGVAKSRVELLSGEHNRNKRLRILSPKNLPLGISRD